MDAHAHAYIDNTIANELNAYLSPQFRAVPFMLNPLSQSTYDTSIKQFYVTPDFRAQTLGLSTNCESPCTQKIIIRFTTAKTITDLINGFDYEPCKIGYGIP